jgi:ribosomal protein L32
MADTTMEEARARMIAKRFGGNVGGASTGGEGSSRRKKKAATKQTSAGMNICIFYHTRIIAHVYCFKFPYNRRQEVDERT